MALNKKRAIESLTHSLDVWVQHALALRQELHKRGLSWYELDHMGPVPIRGIEDKGREPNGIARYRTEEKERIAYQLRELCGEDASP